MRLDIDDRGKCSRGEELDSKDGARSLAQALLESNPSHVRGSDRNNAPRNAGQKKDAFSGRHLVVSSTSILWLITATTTWSIVATASVLWLVTTAHVAAGSVVASTSIIWSVVVAAHVYE